MEDLGLKIKALRESYDMTQAVFGNQINVSRGHIAFVENGGKATESFLKKICKKFHLQIEDFSKPLMEFEFSLTNKEYVSKYDEEELMKLLLKTQDEVYQLQKENFWLNETNSLLKDKVKFLEEKNSELMKTQKK